MDFGTATYVGLSITSGLIVTHFLAHHKRSGKANSISDENKYLGTILGALCGLFWFIFVPALLVCLLFLAAFEHGEKKAASSGRKDPH